MESRERYSGLKYINGQAVEVPLAGGRVYFYEPDSDIPKDTFADKMHITRNTRPVILDGQGEATIYRDGEYRVVVIDQSGKVIRVSPRPPVRDFVEPIGG
jgi:hypothetical protein